ncbi:MAG: HipA N-terminal domain-containing protein [Campylobacterota bacterium]|nr:HipA N-terminal domain-containing protein [Campylobacterota bacterium]
MQKGRVFRNRVEVGEISKDIERDKESIYLFSYVESYLKNPDSVPISVNFPLRKEAFSSSYLFAFFANMLAEGNAKTIQCQKMRIDESDIFTRLLLTVKHDPVGSITVEEIV